MTVPLPALGSNDWFSWASQLHGRSVGLTSFYDSFVGKADGALTSLLSDSGHTWIVTGGVLPVRYNGALGYPSGHVPGAGAAYAQVNLGEAVTWVGGMLRWDTSDMTGSSMTFGAFDTNGYTGSTSSPMHLAVTPASCQFSVFAGGIGDFTSLIPDGYDTNLPRFPMAMPCDGTTTTRVDVLIDRDAAKAYVTIGDNPTLTYSDSRIAIAANYALWEPFSATSNDNLPRMTSVWAESTSNKSYPAHATAKAAMVAAIDRATGGGGTRENRPYARMRPGAAWYEASVSTTLSAATLTSATTITTAAPLMAGQQVTIDTGTVREVRTVSAASGVAAPYSATVTALTYAHSSGAAVTQNGRPTVSDGSVWRDTVGLIAGNLIDHSSATAHESGASPWGVVGGTFVRVRRPSTTWRTPGIWKVTATATGTLAVYQLTFSPLSAGIAYAAGTGQVLGSAARSAYTALRFIDNSGAGIGSDLVGSTISLPTTTPVFQAGGVGVAPATTTQASWLLFVTNAVSGDVFYFTEPYIVPGAQVTAPVRT